MGHKLDKWSIGIAMLAVLVVIVLLFRSCGGNAEIPSTETNLPSDTLDFTPAKKPEDNRIIIPGMTGIYMKSGQVAQTVNFYNPEQNACYFVLSLYLSDNTLIYQSDHLAPGEYITEITLNQELQRGVYGKCRLVYECFTLDNLSQLNTGEVVLEINST